MPANAWSTKCRWNQPCQHGDDGPCSEVLQSARAALYELVSSTRRRARIPRAGTRGFWYGRSRLGVGGSFFLLGCSAPTQDRARPFLCVQSAAALRCRVGPCEPLWFSEVRQKISVPMFLTSFPLFVSQLFSKKGRGQWAQGNTQMLIFSVNASKIQFFSSHHRHDETNQTLFFVNSSALTTYLFNKVLVTGQSIWIRT
jgi:hypothetical protein